MSSRALRRLQEQNEISKLEQLSNLSNAENEEKIDKKTKSKKKNIPTTANLFDLLNEDGDEIRNIEEEDVFEEEMKEELSNTTSITNFSNGKKRKKKKKKKKKAQEDLSLVGGKSELDDIEQTILEVNQILGVTSAIVNSSNATGNTDQKVLKNTSILYVDPRNLNPDNEMKRKFGSAVIQGERRRNPHERRFKRTTSLVQPRPNWPPYQKVGLSMTQVRNEESDRKIFSFEHKEAYQKVQFLFYDAVESLDHNNIMTLVNNHPYHVDSLLQISEVCRMNEDFQMAAELIERALFVFEYSFHTLFNITHGECRLEYKRSENRPFFLALFRHIKYIGEKACYKTALEFCKVLLGLDPNEDPLCVLLLMDYYAIKAEEYSYFIQLYDELEESRNVSLLPNFCYSYALAKFYNGNEEEADSALQKALILFPSMLVELMDRCGISLDDFIKTNPLFDSVSYISQSESLNQLNSLYVGRSYSLWKPQEVLNWLTKNCCYILENLSNLQKEIEEKKNIRNTRYKKSPINILRHILVSDIKEAMRHLPVEVRNQTVMTHDPLPPPDSMTGYERPTRNNRQNDEGILSMFLQSLLPSYNPNSPQLDDQQELQNEARALDREVMQNALQDGAARVMDAIRDMLNTMTYRNDGVGNENIDPNEPDPWEDEQEE